MGKRLCRRLLRVLTVGAVRAILRRRRRRNPNTAAYFFLVRRRTVGGTPFHVRRNGTISDRLTFYSSGRDAMKALKIAVVGGGSTYTPELIDGFVRYYDELPIREIYLQDIDAERLGVVGGLAQRMVAERGIPVTLTTERAEALDGADFVLTQLRVGGMAARALDERIPLKYGVLGQETTGPGGFAKALRTVPVMLEIARDIERYAPGAWLINFTNPSGLVTQALLNYSNVRAIGLCNVPINMQRHIAQALDVEPERVELDYVGLNHLSWVRHVYLDGEDVTARVLANAAVLDAYPVDADLLGKMGMLLNYYLLYYYHTDRALAKQQSAERTRAEYLQEIEAELLEMYRDPSLKEKPALLESVGGRTTRRQRWSLSAPSPKTAAKCTSSTCATTARCRTCRRRVWWKCPRPSGRPALSR